jgi:hypothetical protein
MADLSSRITIMAIGVNRYNDYYLPTLSGAHKDVEKIKGILTKNKKTSIYSLKQFIELKDPTSTEFKEKINEYVLDRSADGDILILYFSGHGVAVGRDDFGFCTTDTVIHPNSKVVLPLSVVRFSEILHTLNVANIIPVVIIDACYSGIAGKRLIIPPIEAISTIQNQIHTVAASSYALLCSCSELEPSVDTPDGGVFSSQLAKILTEGLEKHDADPSVLTLHDVFYILSENVLSTNVNTIPRLYLGPTLPKFPFALNTKFKTKSLVMSPMYISILDALWNNGTPKSLTPDEIKDICGNGAYGNHSKLSLDPWQLVYTIPNPKRRKLTKRGELFMQDRIKIPKKITRDPASKKWIKLKDAEEISFSSFKN